MDKLKVFADNTTAFLKEYGNVKDVWTDPRGLNIIVDLALIFGMEINIELVKPNTPTEG